MDELSFEEYVRGYKDFLSIFGFKDDIDIEEMEKRYLRLKKEKKNENDSAEQ